MATHVGGNGQPDGILVAPLGVAGYRVVLECKTASPGGIVSNPRAEEAAKFRESAGATKSVLPGPAFGGDASLDDELRVHGVALWTVEDLCTALTEQMDRMRFGRRLRRGVRRRLFARSFGSGRMGGASASR